MHVAAVAAVADNGVIGDEDGLPWDYTEDLERFRDLTMGSPIILGRRTHENIVERAGGPLERRQHIVLTSSETYSDRQVFAARGIGGALAIGRHLAEDDAVYVAGGGSVYEQMIPLCTRLYLTRIPEAPDGGTFFAGYHRHCWQKIEHRERESGLEFFTFERIHPCGTGDLS